MALSAVYEKRGKTARRIIARYVGMDMVAPVMQSLQFDLAHAFPDAKVDVGEDFTGLWTTIIAHDETWTLNYQLPSVEVYLA